MADGDEPEDDEVIIRAERAVGGKDLCEFFPRLVRKSKPLSTAGATGTEPETASEPEDGSDKEDGQGQGESTGITSGLEPHNLITDVHELRDLGKESISRKDPTKLLRIFSLFKSLYHPVMYLGTTRDHSRAPGAPDVHSKCSFLLFLDPGGP